MKIKKVDDKPMVIHTKEKAKIQPTIRSRRTNCADKYSAGSIDESMLSNNEKEMVAQFANEIDISNATVLSVIGSG